MSTDPFGYVRASVGASIAVGEAGTAEAEGDALGLGAAEGLKVGEDRAGVWDDARVGEGVTLGSEVAVAEDGTIDTEGEGKIEEVGLGLGEGESSPATSEGFAKIR